MILYSTTEVLTQKLKMRNLLIYFATQKQILGGISMKSKSNSEIPTKPRYERLLAIDEAENEAMIRRVNNNCSIVKRNEMNVVGIKIALTSDSTIGFLGIAEKYIKDGTIELLEKLLKDKNPRRIIGIMTNIRGCGNFEYTIGFDVDDFDKLPEVLPENTGKCICNSGTFVKMNKPAGVGKYKLWDYFIEGFRDETNYVFEKNNLPYQVFNKNAELIYAYEPEKIPMTEEEKYDSINYEIMVLPAINFTGIKANLIHGVDEISEYFNKYTDIVDQLPNRRPYIQDYLGFVLDEGEVKYGCFGAQVLDFKNLPEGISNVTLKSGLYAHITQLEINNDNPSALYRVIDNVFFKANPSYQRDSSRCEIERFHQGHSASIYVPILKKT